MLRQLIVVMGCLHLLGGSFGVLQVVAWANMLVQYSTTEGVAEGISKTFDGEHPCSLCIAIKDAKSQEQENQPLQLAGDKLSLKDLTLPQSITLRNPAERPAAFASYPDPAVSRGSRPDLPPVPPPRQLA